MMVMSPESAGWDIVSGVGVTALGVAGMRAIQVAILGKLSYTVMANAIFTHPLLAEGLNTLFAMFDG